jgi:hypothetical protein
MSVSQSVSQSVSKHGGFDNYLMRHLLCCSQSGGFTDPRGHFAPEVIYKHFRREQDAEKCHCREGSVNGCAIVAINRRDGS